ADRSDKLSRTDMLDLMRANTVVKAVPIELGAQNTQNLTVAVTVGFTDRRPEIATTVANELITLFLAEDARNRTSRASETTKFLKQEVEKLQAELAVIDEKILESRRQMPVLEGAMPQLAALKAELAAKQAVFSDSHPEVRRLKAQIEALEKTPITVTRSPTMTIGNLAMGQMLDPLLL